MTAVRAAMILGLAAGSLLLSSAGAQASESPPSIVSESVSHLSSTDATLEAQVNTGSVATHYQLRLEYGCDLSGNEVCPQYCIYGEPCPGPQNGPVNIPLPEGDLPGSSGVEHVSLDLNTAGVTLQPSTKYRYSIEATNAAGTAKGPGQIFTTPAMGASPPSEVVVEPAEPGTKGFKLKGKLNPEDSPTSYYFEYGEQKCDELPSCKQRSAEGSTLNGGIQQGVGSIEVTGLTVGETYWYTLVASNANGTVRSNTLTFTGRESYRPSIDSESVSAITGNDATLEAQINPDGAETTYEFYLEAPSCANDKRVEACEASGGVLIAKGSIPAGSTAQTVSVDVASARGALTGNTIDGYRVVAKNSVGESLGNEKTFTTLPSGAPPSIEGLSASGITQTDATLQAQINPQGQETEYELWMDDPCAPPMECIRDVLLLEGTTSTSKSISIDLASSLAHLNIEPDTTYEYWVIAKSAGGTVETRHVFRTLAPAPVIESESASNVTEHDATLEAKIDTKGEPAGAYYQFQLVKEPSEYRAEIACPLRSELRAADGCQGPEVQGAVIGYLAMKSGSQTVSVDAASLGVKLEPAVTYHYRVLAASKIQEEDTINWEAPPVPGADQTFTTSSSRARPLGNEPDTTDHNTQSGTPNTTVQGAGSSALVGLKPAVSGKNAKSLTRAQKLRRALKACQKLPKRKRLACQRRAKKRYPPVAKKNAKKK